jgi:hypothetical protein
LGNPTINSKDKRGEREKKNKRKNEIPDERLNDGTLCIIKENFR